VHLIYGLNKSSTRKNQLKELFDCVLPQQLENTIILGDFNEDLMNSESVLAKDVSKLKMWVNE